MIYLLTYMCVYIYTSITLLRIYIYIYVVCTYIIIHKYIYILQYKQGSPFQILKSPGPSLQDVLTSALLIRHGGGLIKSP